ncbi:MAG: hypothetical protein QMD46_12060 [Methanomicrobiales archaeon]|nr:hypothetical protein [Methanomicrobiales archaeon]MDI6876895.1 hypothetical protein [Methanomicrobiales archaeon]
MKINLTRYMLYLVRWQASTPLLAGVLILLAALDTLTATIVANLIGGLIFFWVDRFIFTSRRFSAQWEVKENIRCVDCGRTARGYRLVKTANYDRTDDRAPQFRCESCSQIKTAELKKRGVQL